MYKIPKNCILAAILAVTFMPQITLADETKATDNDIDQAIKLMRETNLDTVRQLSEQEREKKAAELDDAWKTLITNGDTSVDKLKKEYRRMESNHEKNDFFALGISAILWQIKEAEEADFIAEIWRNADLSVNYNYVFTAAFRAAMTRDPKVLPMLRAVLKDKKGSFFLHGHSMNLQWPDTLKFIWGAYGYNGLKELHSILKESKDPAEQEAAMGLLADSYYMPALEDIRKLTQSENKMLKNGAYLQLGHYGQPEDIQLLVNAAKEGEASAMMGLIGSFNRAAIDLIDQYFNSGKEGDQETAFFACYMLPSRKGLDLVIACNEGSKKTDFDKKALQHIQESILKRVNCTLADYKKLDDAGKDKLFADFSEQADVPDTVPKITHDRFVEAVKYWQSKNRIKTDQFEDVTLEQALAIATPDDIEMLIDLKARIYERLSDEALYDIRKINNLIKNILQKEAKK